MTGIRSLGLIAAAAVLALASGAWARAQGVGGLVDGSDLPIEISADNGLEWQQDQELFIARGNAKAVRGEVTVLASELRAYYRKLPKGGTDIWRLDAIRDVRITSPGETVTGEEAVYDVDNGVLVISGGKPKLVAGTDVITADQQLEYWELKQMAVARGNAVAVRADKRLRADVLTAHFRADKKTGKNKIYRVDAYDNVRVRTADDDVTADRGVYYVDTGIATLTGSVVIVRDGNVLNGCSADINLNTGVSRLKACPRGQGERVRGVLTPEKKGE